MSLQWPWSDNSSDDDTWIPSFTESNNLPETTTTYNLLGDNWNVNSDDTFDDNFQNNNNWDSNSDNSFNNALGNSDWNLNTDDASDNSFDSNDWNSGEINSYTFGNTIFNSNDDDTSNLDSSYDYTVTGGGLSVGGWTAIVVVAVILKVLFWAAIIRWRWTRRTIITYRRFNGVTTSTATVVQVNGSAPIRTITPRSTLPGIAATYPPSYEEAQRGGKQQPSMV